MNSSSLSMPDSVLTPVTAQIDSVFLPLTTFDVAQVFERMALGGPVVIILIALSLIAMTVAMYKGVELFMAKGSAQRAVRKALVHWQKGQQHEAIARIAKRQHGTARIVVTAMQGVINGMSDSLMREELMRLLAAERESVNRHLRTLDVIGHVSPLLGLFGTVLGMIEAFRQMEAAGAAVDPSVLSGGIWQALLTTGVGLAVAIPVVLVHQMLERRADYLIHQAQDQVTQVLTAPLYSPAKVSHEARSNEHPHAV